MMNDEVMILLSIPDGTLNEFDEINLGLNQRHCYALIGIVKVENKKLFIIRNPNK